MYHGCSLETAMLKCAAVCINAKTCLHSKLYFADTTYRCFLISICGDWKVKYQPNSYICHKVLMIVKDVVFLIIVGVLFWIACVVACIMCRVVCLNIRKNKRKRNEDVIANTRDVSKETTKPIVDNRLNCEGIHQDDISAGLKEQEHPTEPNFFIHPIYKKTLLEKPIDVIENCGNYERIPGCATYNSPTPSIVATLIDNIPNKQEEN